MSQQTRDKGRPIGLYLNPAEQGRIDFRAAADQQFERLYLADGIEQARLLLRQQAIDVLVLDLARFDRSFDLFALRELIAHRAGAPTLLLCPFHCAGWLPDLMAAGPVHYAVTPLAPAQLRAALDAQLSGASEAPPADPSLRSLLATVARMQLAVGEVDDMETMAQQACFALAAMPGVVHAALFYMRDASELELAAQQSSINLDIHQVLQRTDRLMQSPLRHFFPGLLAACTGDLTLLDDPAKAGDTALAGALDDAGVGMVIGIALPASRQGARRGSVSLMYERARTFSADEMGAFVQLAQLAGLGVRMAEMRRENEQLQGRLSHLATTDALTSATNRRHGEYLLELEARRARRYQLPLSLLVFDIDRLKAVNDQFGHAVGDAAIRAVAASAGAALRESDILVRSGAGEFQIVAPHTNATDALRIADKIRLAIADTDIPGCDRVTVSVAAGQLTGQESPDALTVRVATSLARAKRAGGNCVELALY